MTARFALIDVTGLVVNTILAEHPSHVAIPPGLQLIPGDTANVGDQWDGNAFVRPPQTPQQLADAAADAALTAKLEAIRNDAACAQIRNAIEAADNPAQIVNYVNNNVTDLASARQMLVRIALLLAITIRRS